MCTKKRIIRELTKTYPDLQEKYNINYSLILLNYDEKINQIGLIYNNNISNNNISNNNNLKLTFTHLNSYPFKPPHIQLKNATYTRWSTNITKNKSNDDIFLAYIFTVINIPITYKYFKTIPNNKDCLCCDSLTCGNNWGPGYNLFDLTIEYLSRKKLELFLKPLMLKYISTIFYDDNWKTPVILKPTKKFLEHK